MCPIFASLQALQQPAGNIKTIDSCGYASIVAVNTFELLAELQPSVDHADRTADLLQRRNNARVFMKQPSQQQSGQFYTVLTEY